jgi:hypothetical protein
MPQVMIMPAIHIQIRAGAIQLTKALVILQPINGRQTHTLHRRISTRQHSMEPTNSITQPTSRQTITIPDLRGIVRLGGTQLNCCPPTTPDTEYSPETASTLGSRPNTSKPGRTVKLRLA